MFARIKPSGIECMELKALTSLITAAVIFLLTVGVIFALKESPSAGLITESADGRGNKDLRIISLTPSVTEILYFIGAGDMVKGRTRYCAYPAEVKEKPELGGLFDVNYEGVLTLSPDIVILSELQRDVSARLKALGINYLTVNHSNFEGVMQSFSLIGDAVGKDSSGIAESLNTRIASIRERAAAYPPKKVLVAVSREGGRFVVAGSDGFYSEALKLLNAENPFAKNAPYTTISREGLRWVKPDLIIALSYQDGVNRETEDGICTVSGSFGFTPGPRFPVLLESFARCIHPEGFTDGS
ncbi:MAG: helical backbone metal receptor [Deferribacteraceae bacterium]|jgi:ABC-type Fe3+-hydroxamate transport system substrate-binding protein|nr:helical backbone metal receptor [Deferribacteraceae bacterium]